MKGVTAQFEELTVKFYLKQGGANSQIIPKNRLVKFHLGSDSEVYNYYVCRQSQLRKRK